MSRFFGMKPAPMPWIGCGLGAPPEMTGECVGSTANTLSFGHAFFSTRAQPVMWPPVPTPVISASSPSGKSARISRAVVRTWTSMLAGLSNCCGIQAPGVAAIELLRLGDRALHALRARREHERRAVREHQPPPLDRHAVRHHQHQLVALDRRDHREADAGVARRGLDDRAARLELAGRLGVLDHRQRDAVLDRAAGVRALGLDPDVGGRRRTGG